MKIFKITRFPFPSRAGVMSICSNGGGDGDKYLITFDKFGDIMMSINYAFHKRLKDRKNIIIDKEYAIKLLDILNKSHEASLNNSDGKSNQ